MRQFLSGVQEYKICNLKMLLKSNIFMRCWIDRCSQKLNSRGSVTYSAHHFGCANIAVVNV